MDLSDYVIDRDLSRLANAKKRDDVPVFTALFLTFIRVQGYENCVQREVRLYHMDLFLRKHSSYGR